MSVDTLVTVRPALPRVNLLPQEINEAARGRKIKAGLGMVVVAALVASGFLYMAAGSKVSEAQTSLEASQASTVGLQKQVTAHSGVTAIKKSVQDRQLLLTSAMSTTVPWARYLNSVRIGLPRGARLVTWDIQMVGGQTTVLDGAFGSEGVANWIVTGEAKRYEDIALVVESLQQVPHVDSVFVTKANEFLEPSSEQIVYQFTAIARVDKSALAGYKPEAGR